MTLGYGSLKECLIQFLGNRKGLALQLVIIDILAFGVDKMLQIIDLIFGLLQFLLRRTIRGKLIMHLIFLLSHIRFVIGSSQRG